jgi:hypothetical protein
VYPLLPRTEILSVNGVLEVVGTKKLKGSTVDILYFWFIAYLTALNAQFKFLNSEDCGKLTP